jgi:hypothetical protein
LVDEKTHWSLTDRQGKVGDKRLGWF